MLSTINAANPENSAAAAQVSFKGDLNVVCTQLHMHSKDLNDSHNPPKKVCEYIKSHGGNTVVLTQHGVAAEWLNFKASAKEAGLKFIPGVETYYKKDETDARAHLVLLAKNDAGRKAIGMAISDAQDNGGYSIMTDEILAKYFGRGSIGHNNVVMTSACITGPIALIIRQNERFAHEQEKIRARANGLIVDEQQIAHIQTIVSKVEQELKVAKTAQAANKKLANAKFGSREKAVKKAEGTEAYDSLVQALEADKAAAKDAADKIQFHKENVDKINKKLKAQTKRLKELLDKKTKSEAYAKQIAELEAQKKKLDEIKSEALQAMRKFVRLVGNGNFFAEVQYHGIDLEEKVYPLIVEYAHELSIPLVATNDVHTITNSEDEILRRNMLKATRFEKWSGEEAGDDQLCFRTNGEMISWLSRILPADDVTEAMNNIQRIVDMCDVKFEHENHHPKFIPGADPSVTEKKFLELIEEGVKWRFPNGFPDEKVYRDRLNHEIHIMSSMGYIDYHLVVRDFNQYVSLYDYIPPERFEEAPIDREELEEWIKKNGYVDKVGISNGFGRGSGVGSLVCYVLGITHLDPIKYGLLFERFLNPERVSMPDIDSDFARRIRSRAIEYVKGKYGEECVCGIMTTNAQAPKGAIRIAAKCYGLYQNRNDKQDNGAKKFLSLGDTIAKKVPDGVGIKFATVIDGVSVYDMLRSEFAENADACEIISWARSFEDGFTAYGAHAAGIVITDGTPVKEITPLRWNSKLGIYTTQCDMVQVEEECGMLKFDFLGLKTLDIITDCVWTLYRQGIKVDLQNIDLFDARVYSEILAAGKTDSVFQFESSGMKQMLKRFKPTCFEDLIILVSMFRPGPLQYLDEVIDVKNGVKPLTFLTPELEPILAKTYSAICYQEQVMEIFQKLAGYTLGGADNVRRFMSKKKMDKLVKERQAFVYGDPSRNIPGCIANGIDETAANKLFDQMEEFAKYCFNKSHAAAYAFLAYITAWLKCYYPAEFLMAAMRFAEKTGKKDPIPGLMAEAKSLGVEVCAPDVNHSGTTFTVENGRILFGLGAVKSVGASADEILEERNANGPFRSLADFFRRCSKVKKNAVESLVRAGAFDCFADNRQAMISVIDSFKTIAKKINEKFGFIQTAKAMLPFVDSLETAEDVIRKQELLGVHKELKTVTTSDKLLMRIINAEKAHSTAVADFEAIEIPLDEYEDTAARMKDEKELIGAYVTAHPMDSYPSNEDMNVTTIEDIDGHTGIIYGAITKVDIRKRKKDGKPMAFLTVEDKTGSIQVNVYTGPYAKYEKLIEDGAVVLIDGKVEEHEVFGTGGDDLEPEMEYIFVAERIRTAYKKMKKFVMSVTSMAVFHAHDEAAFRERYETHESGHSLIIFDEMTSRLYDMNWKIVDAALSLPNVKQV